MDNKNEIFPVVDEDGNITGSVTREKAHSGSKILHPVVHLHVFNSAGEIYLQKRPEWKDIQPGKWDTATGGHVNIGENIEKALRREVKEELGIDEFLYTSLGRYIFESEIEKELVYVHKSIYDKPILPDSEELETGKFWNKDDIRENLGKGIFTPNFENEYKKYFQ